MVTRMNYKTDFKEKLNEYFITKCHSQVLAVKKKHYKIWNHSYILNQRDNILGKETILKVSSVSPQSFLSCYDQKNKK